jgi:hypothetical protein
LLETFEWLTNEFQGNKVSSSRVYPTIIAVKHKLSDTSQSYCHTVKLREDLLKSLNKRFNEYIEKDCFKLATYLDPLMGPLMFKSSERQAVVNILKRQIAIANPSLANNSDESSKTVELKSKIISHNFIKYDNEAANIATIAFDTIDACIEKYNGLITSNSYEDTLLFWKVHESVLPLLAPLAKKFLGVPASSASVERMFNIAGHVYSNKRRRTGVKLFENLVYCKLNEAYL